ncbi:MAG TPA: amidase family protein, partial [Pyrinomonadaceae bacterium]|nr:amidase family protein [Pyrinomonadaceae bacterium]
SKAQSVRSLIKRDFIEAFKKCDAILTPTSPTTAFRLGERLDDPLAMYLSDIYTVTANLAGVPAVSVPCGLSSSGLPIGLQLIGNFWKEDLLLNLANVYENNFPLGARPKVYAA